MSAFPKPAVGTRFTVRDVECEVAGGVEPATDFFGRRMRKVWVRRLDTNEEGWYMYGPGAVCFGEAS